MRNHHDKELKSVISFLLELADKGTLELGQKEALTKAINNLRRANRSDQPAKIRAAVDRVVRVFLRVNGR
jgi:hypothetical protein